MEDKSILKKPFYRRKFFKTLVIIILVLLPFLTTVYGSREGRIIDAETKKPIEGVVVLAYWTRAVKTPAGIIPNFYEAKEAVTDKDGYYKIPWYFSINLFPIISYFRGPGYIFYKPGYELISYGRSQHGQLSIHAIGPSERTYQDPHYKKDARGNLIEDYSTRRKKKYAEGLVYFGDMCKQNEAAFKRISPDWQINGFYIPMEDARNKIRKSKVPLECPKESEPLPSAEEWTEVDEMKKYVINSFRITELQKLKTREDRAANIPSPDSEMSHNKAPELIKAINQESVSLGLSPY